MVYGSVDTINLKQETVDSAMTHSLPLGKFKTAVAVYKGFVFVLGGASGVSGYRPKSTNSMYKYNLASNEWETIRKMTMERIDTTAFNVSSFIFVAGGWNPSKKQLDDLECYDIECNQWVNKKNLPHRLDMLASCVVNGVAYISGGRLLDETVFSGIWSYSASEDKWDNAAVMRKARWDHAMASDNNKIYICGGGDGKHLLTSVEVFDPDTRQTSILEPMPYKRKGTMAVHNKGFIYIPGGWGRSLKNNASSGATDDIMVYEIATNRWRVLKCSLSHPVAWSSCVNFTIPESDNEPKTISV